jgi:branched-chain amino acid transport system ATP-binding protein
MSLLQLEQLRRSFGGVRAVDGVSFTLAAGAIAALIGPNGAGKSTLFNLIDGQLTPHSGRVLFDGEPMAARTTAQRTRRGIGRTFQVAQTFATLTVLQNVQLALVAAHGGASDVVHLLWDMQIEAANLLLAQVGLQRFASDAAATLAYGDVKRLELALALAAKPRLLLMDEPTAGMAASERTALMQTIVALAQATDMGVLFTEHSMDVVFAYADRMIVLARGRLIAQGKPAEIRDHPKVQEVYFGTGRTFEKKAAVTA